MTTPLPASSQPKALGDKPIWRDSDISLDSLQGKTIAIIGYGNQGRPQALNLKDSGLSVIAGARKGGQAWQRAIDDTIPVFEISEASRRADIIMLLLPDETIPNVFNEQILPSLESGKAIGFGHGLAIHTGWLSIPQDIDVLLIAPKGQGRGVRNKYLLGSGVPALVSVSQDTTGNGWELAKAYAKGIGSGRVGIMPTTFEEETVCDLFTEQTLLCGGLNSLVQAAFETLVEAGYAPETAYFECLYEVKLVADLIHERGITGMREGISNTARFGDITQGKRVIDGHVKEQLRQVLANIQNGNFAESFKADSDMGSPIMSQRVLEESFHPIERAHHYLQETGILGQAQSR